MSKIKLEELIEQNVLSEEMAEYLKSNLDNGMVIIGFGGSGKTMLLSALTNKDADELEDRLANSTDTFERLLNETPILMEFYCSSANEAIQRLKIYEPNIDFSEKIKTIVTIYRLNQPDSDESYYNVSDIYSVEKDNKVKLEYAHPVTQKIKVEDYYD